jgi:hypothetical protein
MTEHGYVEYVQEYVIKGWREMGMRELGTYNSRAAVDAALPEFQRTGRAAGYVALSVCERFDGNTWGDRVRFTIQL